MTANVCNNVSELVVCRLTFITVSLSGLDIIVQRYMYFAGILTVSLAIVDKYLYGQVFDNTAVCEFMLIPRHFSGKSMSLYAGSVAVCVYMYIVRKCDTVLVVLYVIQGTQ